MLSRKIAAARPLSTRIAPAITSRTTLNQLRSATTVASQAPNPEIAPPASGPVDFNDPDMDPGMVRTS